MPNAVSERILAAVDEKRLVGLLVDAIGIPSPTGHEQAMAEFMGGSLRDAGMTVSIQEIEDGRANAVGTLEGTGAGPRLMFNGHIDTSYSGDEPWLTGIGFRPEATLRDGLVYGLGAANMKGAVCCYVEAVRALRDAGIRLAGDVVVAAVAGEIEKAQWPGDDRFVGKDFRGYSSGSRYLVSHGGVADVCIIGEPTEHRIVTGQYGTIWVRISTTGPFVHTAFSTGRLKENAIVRMAEVLDSLLEWIPDWEARTAYRGEPGVVNVGAIDAGFPWRVSRTPSRADLFLDVRIPPTMTIPQAHSELRDLVTSLRSRFPDHGIDWEVFVTVPGSEIDRNHAVVDALDAAHTEVFGDAPEQGAVRWGSDASVLTRYQIPTVNYGTSSGLPGPDGENVLVDRLVALAQVYALTAVRVCGLG